MRIWGWRTMLKIENLYVNYGGINALRGISLEVQDGEIVPRPSAPSPTW